MALASDTESRAVRMIVSISSGKQEILHATTRCGHKRYKRFRGVSKVASGPEVVEEGIRHIFPSVPRQAIQYFRLNLPMSHSSIEHDAWED